jgi:hypothetical protein
METNGYRSSVSRKKKMDLAKRLNRNHEILIMRQTQNYRKWDLF